MTEVGMRDALSASGSVDSAQAIDPASPVWSLAARLDERLASPAPPASSDTLRGELRLSMWRSEPVFDAEPHRMDSFLRRWALTEPQLTEILGEPVESVYGRLGPVLDHPRSLARAYNEPPPDDSGAVRDMGFAAVAAPLFDVAAKEIAAAVVRLARECPTPRVDPPSLAALLCRAPLSTVVPMVARVVVLELNVLRMQGELAGDTPQERYAHFLRRLADPVFAGHLLAEYPVLARSLVRAADRWATTRIEFAERLFRDVDDIAAHFAEPSLLGAVSAVEFGAGDTHHGGRSVCVVEFTNGGKVVYKPRPMSIDRHFHELLDWLNARGQQPVWRTHWVLDRGAYGWSEFITDEPCPDEAAVRRFYQRQGGYLALLHGLAATDMHLENLIAAGEHPMLIDLEALFHHWRPLPPDPVDLSPGAMRAMRSSVLSVGLLPNPIVWQDEDGTGRADLSGLAGAAGQLSPTAVALFDDGGTDRMHLIRRRLPMSGSRNLPTLDGATVDALDYRTDLVEGFRATYRLLVRHREALRAPGGPVASFADDQNRIIVRPTRSYAAFLLESYHPDLLRDALDRDRFFENLWSGHPGVADREAIIAAEVAQMHDGDIPLFRSTPGSLDLMDGDGGILVARAFPQTGVQCAIERLTDMSEDDLLRQTWFVEASLTALVMGTGHTRALRSTPVDERASASASPSHATVVPAEPAVGTAASAVPVDASEYVATAGGIGDRLLALALGDDTVSWLGLNLVGDRVWHLSPTGSDLFGGVGGIALFLAHLAEVTTDDRHRSATERAVTVLTRHSQLLVDAPDDAFHRSTIGAFTGLGSIVYALSHLDALLGRPELGEAAERLLPMMRRLAERDRSLDVVGGSAGAIFAALALHAVRPAGAALVVAGELAARLESAAAWTHGAAAWRTPLNPDAPLAGFSHGASGIITALARLDRIRATRDYTDLVLAGVRFERTLFDVERRNWRDVRSIAGQAGGDMVAWCHGAPGVGLARADLAAYLPGEPLVIEDLHHAAEVTWERGLDTGNHCICHGDLGNVEALSSMGAALGDPMWTERGRWAAGSVLRDIRERGWSCGVPLGVETPGLMAGLAGIGYGLLRLAAPEKVPSLLTLQPPTGRAAP